SPGKTREEAFQNPTEKSLRLSLADFEQCPRPRLHIAQQRRFPSEFGMRFKKGCSKKIHSAGVAHMRVKAHRFSHRGIHDLSLHRPTRIVRPPFPNRFTARGKIAV